MLTPCHITLLLQMHELGKRMGPVLHLGEELAVAPPPSEPRAVAKAESISGESKASESSGSEVAPPASKGSIKGHEDDRNS